MITVLRPPDLRNVKGKYCLEKKIAPLAVLYA